MDIYFADNYGDMHVSIPVFHSLSFCLSARDPGMSNPASNDQEKEEKEFKKEKNVGNDDLNEEKKKRHKKNKRKPTKKMETKHFQRGIERLSNELRDSKSKTSAVTDQLQNAQVDTSNHVYYGSLIALYTATNQETEA